MHSEADETGRVGPAAPDLVAIWCRLVPTMDRHLLDSFEERTFRWWDPASLGDLAEAIGQRRRELKPAD